ncbi:methyltransferase domain-containing protein [Solirubrobacter phytolaccae]|uniref:Methyltransferase domain-containing protein n=1 Tax=Solirubrobacter phytolaccae TaxID=1404360 RepID=A0A9X3NE77_9ACTN|nr:methyltransferase domain-containing protein [Solirubrobacter phytolaccae]MDA0184828.1 methyltransferase domain-containing protein [Solirubrobacter phytolaccae]
MDPLDVNRAHWDALAAVHGQDAYYDKDALVSGRDSLNEFESAAVGDVTELDVMHLQCHIGFDSISLARRGAHVTGVDFSPGSLAAAAELAERAGVEIEWVQADATALPETLHGRFDLVYSTIGVLGWIADIDAWMRSVFAALRPGGRLVLVEHHPVFLMVASTDPLILDFPYAFDGPRAFDEAGSYADPNALVASTESVEYAHSIGEVVTAALGAGLRLDTLKEHLDAARDGRGLLTPDADGRCRLRIGAEVLPLYYTVIASR